MSSLEPVPPVTSALPGLSPRTQIAALCWRMHGDHPEVLLITSRDTGRWIVPKGWPMEGRTPAEAAAREAWEEAGVEGRISSEPVGSYGYDKVMPRDRLQPCRVQVFPLRVKQLVSKYPEKGQRRRKWFSLEKAMRKVAEPELRALLLGFRPPVLAGTAGNTLAAIWQPAENGMAEAGMAKTGGLTTAGE